MTKHTIILSEPLTSFIDERLSGGDYETLSEYLAELVRQDMNRRISAVRELRTLIDDAEESGMSERSLDEILSHAQSSAPGKNNMA
jgi:antitoxin ParD1/3/4